MVKNGILFMSFLILFSCSKGRENNSKIDKEFYKDGRLKSITYYFKNDEIKKIGFDANGKMDYIHDISNNGQDNFMLMFDDQGQLWMIVPHKNGLRNGKMLYFDDTGKISDEERYVDGKLSK